MPHLPQKLPETGNFARLYSWLNQLRAYVESLRPTQSVGTFTSHTANGVSRETRNRGGSDTEEDSSNIPRWG